MSGPVLGLVGILLLLILLAFRMWIAVAMGLVGFLGFVCLAGLTPALSMISKVGYGAISDYNVSLVPLFILMGVIASNSGIGGDLYHTGYKWIGQFSGGLAMATVAGCSAFAAICGSSMATAVTIGKVALPEMNKYKYDPALASGAVASGGTLGILIPPSMGFILYGILTGESVGTLFISGILPGILLSFLFIMIIFVMAKVNPTLAPKGPKTGFREKISSLKNTWAMLFLFLLVMVGIYGGIFTTTEAGAVGAFGAIIITMASGRLSLKIFYASLEEAGKTTGMILFLLIGAMIFMRFLAITELPFVLTDYVSRLAVSKYVILTVIVFLYLFLGMFLEILSVQALTIPILFPVVVALGFDPIWFGVLVVILIEMGLITPPVGLNVFALSGVTDIPMGTIFKGVWPFVGAMVICILLLVLFPEIALVLPNMMKHG